MSELFDKHGGFRKLHSFTLATLVQLETLRFCRRFLTHDHRDASAKFYDPKGRQRHAAHHRQSFEHAEKPDRRAR